MKPKVVFNNIIPFPGFMAMCLFPYIFVRKVAAGRYNVVANNHEHIHAEQQKEMLIVLFLIWYVAEWLCRLVQYRNRKQAYRNISFEREAYANEKDLGYIPNRKRFAWVRYIKNNQ